jgi:hypothetical protein
MYQWRVQDDSIMPVTVQRKLAGVFSHLHKSIDLYTKYHDFFQWRAMAKDVRAVYLVLRFSCKGFFPAHLLKPPITSLSAPQLRHCGIKKWSKR